MHILIIVHFIYKVIFFTMGQNALQKKIKPGKVDNMKVKENQIRNILNVYMYTEVVK